MTKITRSWGYFKILEEGENFKVKRLCVNSGQKTSTQKHAKRSEHMVCVYGCGKVLINRDVYTLDPGSTVFIDKHEIHRIMNTSENQDLILIETQIGICEEDDITRYDG